MDKFMDSIIPELLLGEQIVKNNVTYTIVGANVQDGNLYIAFADVNEAVKLYGESEIKEEIEQMAVIRTKYLGEWNWCLKPTVIEIKNVYLRSFSGLHSNCKHERDFYKIYGNEDIFGVLSLNADKSVFFKNGLPARAFEDLTFPEEISGLRRILANAMPEECRKQYSLGLKKEYLSKMQIINKEFIEKTKKEALKAKEEGDRLMDLYLEAVANQPVIQTMLRIAEEDSERC